MPPPEPSPASNRPSSLKDLFLAFNWMALQGFGGVLAVVQREVVERRRWLTLDEFIEEWAVAQVMPGPNVVNLGLMLGDRFFGWRGAVCALLGLLSVPLLLVMCLALVYGHFQDQPQVAGALRAMSAVAAGLIMATALKLLPAIRRHPLGIPLCAGIALATFACVALWRVPLLAVLLGLGGMPCVLTWRRLRP